MGVRDDAVRLIRSGKSPGRVAEIMGVNPKTTLSYLDEMVGRGWIRRSDIFFTVPKGVRKLVLQILDTTPTAAPEHIASLLINSGLPIKLGDVFAVVKYRDSQNALGDMYEDIREIETSLHGRIREVLEQKLGKDESGWWRKGIPSEIRKECQSRREEDEDGSSEPYCYTNLIDLWKILKGKWAIFQTELPSAVKSDKNKFGDDIQRLNTIRNIVMHPVRGKIPSEDDFDFVRDFKTRLLG
jgi:hypothetical protein